MGADQWIRRLKEEGFTDVQRCPIPPNKDFPEHTHEDYTVHVIMSGVLVILDGDNEARVFFPGDRVEFLAGTTHKARGATDDGEMIVGVKRV